MPDPILAARPGGALRGRVRAPGDKSISHRALILGALAHGRTEVEGLLEGDDVRATAAAMRLFGAEVVRTGEGRWTVDGRGGFLEPREVVDCGNAGTAVRLIMGAAAAFPIAPVYTGDHSLQRRPMGRVWAPLRLMGAEVTARSGDLLPARVRGGDLRAISYRLPVASAQVKSAVLLAGLGADGETAVEEPEPTRDHTERMIRGFGGEVTTIDDGAGGRTARLAGGQRLAGARVRVPGDPSSAAFPLVAALAVPGSEVRVEGVLLNPLRTGLYDTLREMGADLTTENARTEGGEPVGDLTARHGPLRGVVVPPERAPSMIDEYPVLAALAAFAEGTTVMRGIGELRVKESDRIALMASGLRLCGVEVEEAPDALVVHGGGLPPEGGARVATGGDHRVAMSHLVLGLGARRPVEVEEPGMIATSFPGFVQLMRGLGADLG